MGGIFSSSWKATVDGVAVDNSLSESSRHANNHVDDDSDKHQRKSFSFKGLKKVSDGPSADDFYDGIPRMSSALSHESRSAKSRQAAIVKVSEVCPPLSSFGNAVEVLDSLGSGMRNLNLSSGSTSYVTTISCFTSCVTTKEHTISILAFEVANTIVKGANLMQSLSNENIRHFKEVVLPSHGVQNLISRDIDKLLMIAAADKREELRIFSDEVVRLGNRSEDHQWHNLDRFFEKLGSELTLQKSFKEEADMAMQQLMTFVQYTAELYHELNALDRLDQHYRRKLQEEDNSIATPRDSLAILRAELKSQKKRVRKLKKKSLWSKILEEVMERLFDIGHFLHLKIYDVFGSAATYRRVKDSRGNHENLGSAGLALHYANIITQIDTLVSHSSSVPPDTRDALYQGLPPNIKFTLLFRLQSFQVKEELAVPQIKAEMEKTLRWLVPMATNTTKAYHGFGWIGDWANTGSELNRKPVGHTDWRIETLHHADKDITEAYIFELILWLHYLVIQERVGNGGIRS